ncbi:MAG: S8 family serine peptidase [Bacteroidota bacterium]|nr:S8 family serine peptidase [Candidatus Kapabacteria bacterium]MDW8074577.1 S8 family serine peptidase [Bacteroidota bacterium]
MATPIATAQEKLFLRFRTPVECQEFVSRFPASRLIIEPVLHRSILLLSENKNTAHIQRLVDTLSCIAVVQTTNGDSLRRVLRFNQAILEVRPPFRYRIDRACSAYQLQPSASQWYLDALHARESWKYSTGRDVIVGVIDTGIDWQHPALQQSLWVNKKEDLNGNGRFDPWPVTEIRNGVRGDLDGRDNDNNGYADDVIGYSFVSRSVALLGQTKNPSPFPYDENGHGTAVSALIAAKPTDSSGFTGLAFDAQIMVLRAFDLTGIGDEDDIAAAIVYAVLNGARIINCSFGDIVRSTLIATAIELARAADVVVVASAGNSGSNLPHYPSDEVGVLSIGAATSRGQATAFSSYSERLFLLAPGQSIVTAVPGGGFQQYSGTSFAAPLVSATVALLQARAPWLTAEQIRTILATTADSPTEPWQLRRGHGLVSPLRALEQIELKGIIELEQPLHGSVVSDTVSSVEVVVRVVHPLLEKWQLVIVRRGIERVFIESRGAVFSARYHIEELLESNDSLVVFRLRAILHTGKTIEDAAVIQYVRSGIRVEQFAWYPVWLGRQRRLAVVTRTNRRCEIAVQVQRHDNLSITEIRGDGHYRRLHATVLPFLQGGIYRLKIIAWDGVDTAVVEADSVAIPSEAGFSGDWQELSYRVEPLLLSGSFSPATGALVATRARLPQQALVLVREQDTFRIRAKSDRTLFLRGYGDANNDGTMDVLTYDAGDTRLFQFEPVPFSTVLWGDTVAHTFWAAALADITGDQKPEILGFRTRRTRIAADGTLLPASDALVALSWNGTRFVALDSIELSSAPQRGRQINTISAPLCAVGDFDKDGEIEVAYADSDGDLEIAAWSQGRFTREYSAPAVPFLAGAGTEFVTAADIDGDGSKEIISGAAALPAYNDIGEYEPPLWRFCAIKATAPNQYIVVWEDFFWGVYYGRPYYNGIAAGDLDSDGKDEIVLCLFPYVYVLSWQRGYPEILFVRDSIWSNGAILSDLDGDGSVELGLMCGLDNASTKFFRYTPALLRSPSLVDAYALPTGDIECVWHSAVPDARYRIRINQTVYPQTFDSTRAVLVAQNLPACIRCTVTVQAIRGIDTSRWSNSIEVVRAESLSLERVDTVVEGSRSIRAWFRGYLPPNGIPPASIVIFQDTVRYPVEFTASAGVQQLIAWVSRPLKEGRYLVMLEGRTRDYFGNPSLPSMAELIVTAPQQSVEEFYAEQLLEVTNTSITVRFSDAPVVASLSLDSIIMQPYGKVVAVLPSNDEHALRFVFDSSFRYEPRGMIYTMRFPSSFRSREGKFMTRSSGNTVAWFYSASSTAATFAYPQPWSLSRDRELRFAYVPMGATVVISTLNGYELTRIVCDEPTGGVRWVPQLPDGKALPEGVYLYRVIDKQGNETTVQKFVVVP